VGLAKPDAYFEGLADGLTAKRDRLSAGLARLGFGVLEARGSYFVSADFRPLGFAGDDVAFCRWLTETAKVTAIPVSAFYADAGTSPRHYVRFAFCKHDATLDLALARMEAAFAQRRAETGQRALTG
jgi:aspartate/methionine/tyrosine aminotransferase